VAGEKKMKINHSVELEDGSYTYQGNITGKELEFFVEYAINNLLAQGALPFLTEDGDTVKYMVVPETNSEQ
jgi:hypothetical protein